MILLAFILTLLTAAIHSAASLWALTRFASRDRNAPNSAIRVVVGIAFLVTFLLVAHLVEAGVWAAGYFWSRTLTEPSTALYFSLASYTTVGYGDVVLDHGSRIVGPIESVVGVLMMGWSTAIIVHVVQKAYSLSEA